MLDDHGCTQPTPFGVQPHTRPAHTPDVASQKPPRALFVNQGRLARSENSLAPAQKANFRIALRLNEPSCQPTPPALAIDANPSPAHLTPSMDREQISATPLNKVLHLRQPFQLVSGYAKKLIHLFQD